MLTGSNGDVKGFQVHCKAYSPIIYGFMKLSNLVGLLLALFLSSLTSVNMRTTPPCILSLENCYLTCTRCLSGRRRVGASPVRSLRLFHLVELYYFPFC